MFHGNVYKLIDTLSIYVKSEGHEPYWVECGECGETIIDGAPSYDATRTSINDIRVKLISHLHERAVDETQ